MEELFRELWTTLEEPKIHGPLSVVVAIIVAIVAWATGFLKWVFSLFRKKPPTETSTTASGGAVVAHPNAAVTVQQPGLTFQDHQQALKDRETAIRADLERAHEAEKAMLANQLAEAERRLAAGEKDFEERKAELADISTDIAKIDDLPPEKLHQAQTALKAGRTTEAETLLAEVEREEAEGVERAAQAAFLRGEIAEEDIRWADAAAHYTRAANLAPNYDRLKKAREFIWRAGDYAGAVASGEALIATAAAEFGEGSEKHATAMNDHALTLHDMGRFEEAEPLYRQAIEIDKATTGEAHPDYASSLNNLAELLRVMGGYEEAEPLYRQAIEIDKATIGEAHPDYAAHLNNLACLLRVMGRYEEAEPLYRQAIEIGKATIGEAHPDYATRLNNLAELLRDTGRYEEAEPLYRQAIEIDKATIGEAHPDYATDLNNLAGLLEDMGRYEEAAPLYRQMIGIWRERLGDEHPDTRTGAGNYAIFLREHDPASPDLADLIAAFGDDIGR